MWQIEKKTRLEGLGKCQYSQDFWRQRPRNERSISPIPLFASLWCLSHAKKRKWRAKTIVDLSSWHCNGKGRGSALWPLWKKAWGEGKVLPSMCQWRGWWQKSIWEIFFDKYATTWSVFRPFSSVRPLFLTKKSYFSTLFSIGEFSLFSFCSWPIAKEEKNCCQKAVKWKIGLPTLSFWPLFGMHAG